MVFHLAAMETGRDLIDVRDERLNGLVLARPQDLRLVGAIDYGLTNALTLSAGVARFTPIGRTAPRTTGTLGLRSSLLGLAVQGDLGADDQGGGAFALGVAGRRLGTSFYARHAEFVKNFLDEVQSPRTLGEAVTRSTNVRLDAMASLSKTFAAPLSLNFRRDQFQDGGSALRADARVSMPFDQVVASSRWTYRHETTLAGRSRTVLGDLDVASLWSSFWQLRASLNYEVHPEPRIIAATSAMDIGLSNSGSLRLSATRRMGDETGTLYQAMAVRQLPIANVGLTAGYDTRDGAWTAGVQLAFGMTFNPLRGRYQLAQPGVTSGGSMALQAFIDANNDNQMQPDEERVPGVMLGGGARKAATGADGRVLISGLGDGGYARAKISTEDLDDPFLMATADVIEYLPRPGNVATVLYPLKPTSSLALTVKFDAPGDSAPLGLSALSMQLVSESGATVARGRTEYDGRLVLENVPPGHYKLQLDPGQAQRLGLELLYPVVVHVPEKGGVVEGPVAYVHPALQQAAL
jgi:hypothetical protein